MRKGRSAALLGALWFMGLPTVAEANAGMPMLALLWPASWILFAPIVLVEGLVARRVLRIAWPRAIRLAAGANAVSTLVGIPVTWLLLLALEFAVGYVMPEPRSWWAGALLAPLWAPWIAVSGREDEWALAAAAMWLCIFFFLVSVWLERAVLRGRPALEADAVRRWSWQANLLTYGPLEAALGCWLIWPLIR